MNKKVILMVVGLAVVVGGISFYGGLKYGQRSRFGFSQMGFGSGQMRTVGGRNGGMRMFGSGFTAGTIIAKDDKSITISMRDGSSKIIFFTTATPVMEMVAGKASDIAIGKEVTISGNANPDGSISADSIQIRSALPVSSVQEKTN